MNALEAWVLCGVADAGVFDYHICVSVTLDIPPDFVARLESEPQAAEARLHLELAIALYREGQLPVRRAAQLAAKSEAEFDVVLRERNIPAPYSMNDLEHDLAYARGGR